MIFTMDSLIKSIASTISRRYCYPVYANPNQQGTETPCFFIMLMPSDIKEEVSDFYMFNINIDVVFLQERNATGINTNIYEVMEYLSKSLTLFRYIDLNGAEMWMHGHDSDISIDDQELHYKFHIKERMRLPKNQNIMQAMGVQNVRIKE